MYGVILAAALTAGVTAPDCWNCRTSAGCCGGGTWIGHSGCVGCGHGVSHYGCAGGIGCYGGWHAINWQGLGSNYECWGGHGCYGCSGYMGCGGYASTVPTPDPEVIPPPRASATTSKANINRTNDRARLTIQVPAQARITIDNRPVTVSAEKRTFTTPPLERGQAYYYEVRAELQRDGRTVSETKKVVVRAGEAKVVAFDRLETADVATAEVTPRHKSD